MASVKQSISKWGGSMERYKIVIWGTGDRAEMCFREGYLFEHEIVGFVDSHKNEDRFHSINVYKPGELNRLIDNVDYLVVLNHCYDEILKQCWDMNIPFEKIVISDNVKGFFSLCFERLRLLSEQLYCLMCAEEFRVMATNISDRVDKESKLGCGKYASNSFPTDYMMDYFRFRTFELVAKEVKARGLEGAIAEVGVYRGHFASLINDTFPEKRFYLFDTFESFNPEEYEREKSMGRVGTDNGFLIGHIDTSVDIMLSNIPNPDSCIVCKGLFPDSITAEAEQEKYAFVSLDVDLEESTYQGLKFFYPRLEENGYIFLHDYTTHWLQGVKIAVARYEKDFGVQLKKIPIADRAGTLIITK